MPDNIPTGLPSNTMGIGITPELMAMYLKGLDAQRGALKAKKKKDKALIGLQSKLKDPKAELNKNQKKLLDQLLKDTSVLNPEWRGHTLQ